MLYSTVPRPARPGRQKVSTWMQLDLGFHDRPEASLWERLESEQRVVILQALTRLMIKVTKKNVKEENADAGHE